ncbi:MAG: PadR family transcriptional regulator [Deltaproteobacteria bacterium]|nr:PadR family transcriptional regulator [Deltaproteobacteria bacterium]MBW2304365.1 PadR family transcriptional regulator [Deltaproteobacteria bacterium]
MKTRPAVEYVLLGSLVQGPRHGYEIIRFLESDLGTTWRVGTSQLYSVLKRLEHKGLVRSTVETQETRPSRRVFSLTGEGKKVFESWLHTPTRHVRDMRVEFLAKLFFIRKCSREKGNELLDAQIRVLESIRDKLLRSRERETDPFSRLVWGFRLETIRAWMTWLEQEAVDFLKTSQRVERGEKDERDLR